MKIPPLEPEGGAGVKFNQDMVAPKSGTFLSAKLYDNTFGMKSESLVDGSVFEGKFQQSERQRALEAVDKDSEASKIGFTSFPQVHTA